MECSVEPPTPAREPGQCLVCGAACAEMEVGSVSPPAGQLQGNRDFIWAERGCFVCCHILMAKHNVRHRASAEDMVVE